MWTQVGTAKTVVGTARGRVLYVWTQLVTTKTVVGTARGRVPVDSTSDNKDSSRDSLG